MGCVCYMQEMELRYRRDHRNETKRINWLNGSVR